MSTDGRLVSQDRFRALGIVPLLACCASTAAQAQVPFDSGRWNIDGQGHLLLEYQGKQALYLYNGSATLPDVSLRNGIVEFDVAVSGERGFTGVIWRATEGNNFEEFYIRPHQSGNPDANQYTPVFNGMSGWQLYHGEGYGTPVTYSLNEWTHVKVVFWEEQAQVFIEDMVEPVLRIPELKHEVGSGAVGLRATTPAYFSGFSYRPLDAPPFETMSETEIETPEGMIADWEVSSPFEASRLDPVEPNLDRERFADLTWQRLQSEATGITNFARLHGVEDERNTVIARILIRSDREQTRALRFGYTDTIRVYLNGRPIYGGDNTYMSRDYRYLGTIGLFDEVYLPLQQGDNEVWFAVTEAFGGWGLMAKIDDKAGIRVELPATSSN